MITRRAVEMCRDKYNKEVKAGTRDKKDLIKINALHVNEAFIELFNSKTVQILQQLCKNEVVVLFALYNEMLVKKTDKVLLDDVQDKVNFIMTAAFYRQASLKTNVFHEIVKRLQAFGLIAMEIMNSRLVDNVHLRIQIFEDEIKNGFRN
jgi:hypothetical protein